MREKSDVETIFNNFYTMVQTNLKKIFKYYGVIMVESISKMLCANFFLKKELFIKVLVLTLHNKIVWLKEKTDIYWK